MNIAAAPMRQASAPAQAQPKVFKPVTESWNVNGETFTSTADLVSHSQGKDGQQAIYRFATEAAPAAFTQSEKVRNSVGKGATMAVQGAVVGGLVSAGMAAVVGLGDVLNALSGGSSHGVSTGLMLAPVILGALVGGSMGSMEGYKASPQAPGGEVTGVLKNSNDQLAFYPNGKVEAEVNLHQYQNAPTAEVVESASKDDGAIANTLKGAAAGAIIGPAVFVPVIGLGVGAFVGSAAGEALDKRTALGGGLGLALGAAATVGTIVAANIYGPQALAYAAGGLGVLGAVIGHSVFSRMGKDAHHDNGQQWWSAGLPQR
jgi:hypothetical protein